MVDRIPKDVPAQAGQAGQATHGERNAHARSKPRANPPLKLTKPSYAQKPKKPAKSRKGTLPPRAHRDHSHSHGLAARFVLGMLFA